MEIEITHGTGSRVLRVLSSCVEAARSDESQHKRYFHGACVVSSGKIYGSGFNDSRRCYIRGQKQYSVHAEMMALMMSGLTPLSRKGKCASRRGKHGGIMKKSYDLWVIRVGVGNALRDSHPCNECVAMMRLYGIQKVFYSDEKGSIRVEKVSEMELSRPTNNFAGWIDFPK